MNANKKGVLSLNISPVHSQPHKIYQICYHRHHHHHHHYRASYLPSLCTLGNLPHFTSFVFPKNVAVECAGTLLTIQDAHSSLLSALQQAPRRLSTLTLTALPGIPFAQPHPHLQCHWDTSVISLAKSVGIYLRCVGWGKWRLLQDSEAEFLYVGIAGVRIVDSRWVLLPDSVYFCEYALTFWGNLLLSCWYDIWYIC